MIASEELATRFTYHAPNDEQQEKYIALRDEGRFLAEMIDEKVPDSREKSLALTKLEEVIMWANAGISRRSGDG